MVTQFGEDTDSALRMEEADIQTFSALTGLLVDELYTLICKFLQSFVRVRHSEGDVVDTFSALLDELCDSAFW